MPHLSQSASYKTALILGVAVASVVIGALIVVFASPESIQFASLSDENSTLRPSATPGPATQAVAATAASPSPTVSAIPSNPPSDTPPPESSTTPLPTASTTATATSSSSPTHTATSTDTAQPANTPTLTPAPSSTPVPSPTPLPNNPDRAEFVADITVPDGTEFPPGASFTKTWRIRNIGASTWTTDYTFEFAGGAEMALASSLALPNSVAPGETIDISLEMVAPSNPGNKVSLYQFRTAAGQPFGVGPRYNDFIYVQINVVE